ncbi:MAG: entericidin [Candidatus Omnitrophica bacterium]|nr:entericidin [Candidatus Omnitrophota bacterium]
MKRDYFMLVLVIFLTTLIVGCNMLKGAGTDVENAGKSIQKTVEHND